VILCGPTPPSDFAKPKIRLCPSGLEELALLHDPLFDGRQNGDCWKLTSSELTLCWSRNRLPLEPKFPTIRAAVEELNLRSTILDGEIVALDEEGIPRFQLLQKWQKRPTAPVVYCLFDLLWDCGRDLTGKSVVYRRERLQEIIAPLPEFKWGAFSRSVV
jgi:hypothetical protein